MSRLIADIGGTNARFALVGADGLPAGERNLLVRDYPDVATAAEWFDLLDKDSPESEIAKEGEQL